MSTSTGANDSVENLPTYSLSVFEMVIFRNSILSGTEFYCPWRKSHLMTSLIGFTNWEYESLSYGCYALDQGSADFWFSAWFDVFVINKRNSNAKFQSTRYEDFFSTEQNHPQFSLQKKNHSGGTKGPEAGPFPSWQADCSPDLWVLQGHRSQRFCGELCRPIHYWTSKWWYSVIRFKVGRNSIIYDENPTWWHLW